MPAGKYSNHLFVIEQRVSNPDGEGGAAVVQWIEVGRVFARISAMGANERDIAQQQLMESNYWVDVRNIGVPITSAMRLREIHTNETPAPAETPGSRVLNVRGIYDPEERGWAHRLLCLQSAMRK